MLCLDHVSYAYENGGVSRSVLNDVSVEFQQGEYVVITGESGSGKTTLLHVLAGLQKPSEGKVFFQDREIYRLSDNQLSQWRNESVGMIFQEFYLEENLSVLNNVLFPRFVRGKVSSTDRAEARAVLSEVGLSEKADQKARFLSGGQKQRVAIARALLNSPPIIVADEPTANLDSKTGGEIRNLLQTLHQKKGATIILVTHENGHVGYDRKFSLQNGNLVAL